MLGVMPYLPLPDSRRMRGPRLRGCGLESGRGRRRQLDARDIEQRELTRRQCPLRDLDERALEVIARRSQLGLGSGQVRLPERDRLPSLAVVRRAQTFEG